MLVEGRARGMWGFGTGCDQAPPPSRQDCSRVEKRDKSTDATLRLQDTRHGKEARQAQSHLEINEPNAGTVGGNHGCDPSCLVLCRLQPSTAIAEEMIHATASGSGAASHAYIRSWLPHKRLVAQPLSDGSGS